jgi:hypothetical protein
MHGSKIPHSLHVVTTIKEIFRLYYINDVNTSDTLVRGQISETHLRFLKKSISQYLQRQYIRHINVITKEEISTADQSVTKIKNYIVDSYARGSLSEEHYLR